METPYGAFVARAEKNPDAPFLLAPPSAELAYAPAGFRITYGEAAAEVSRLRALYAGSGYGRGARVALLLENRPAFFFHWLALNGLGAAIQPINPDLRAADLAFQLTLADPDLVVALPERHALIRHAGFADPAAPGEAPPSCHRAVARDHGLPADECALLFTSGTTGQPKGCVLSNDYFMRLARWYVSQGCLAEMRDDAEVVLTPLPMFHMNALACSTLGMILRGGAIVPLDRFHAQRWWRTVADAGATVIHYLGVMPAILLKLAPEEAERAHGVRFGFGAGVDPRHQEAFERRFGFPLVEGWAMTETGAGAVTSTADGARHVGLRCIGRPAAGMDYRIVGEGGADARAGEPGELLVRARGSDPRQGFFTEYLNDSVATVQAWDGGWFHTGDVVCEGPDESLFFVDRKKDIVRRSGENIAVIEVEGVLQSLDGVAGAAVAPVADDIRGEEVCALIEPRERNITDAAQRTLAERIVRDCAARLAYFKAPAYVAFVDAIPVTSTQKLQRGEIRALAAQLVADGRAHDLRDLKGRLRTADGAMTPA